MPGGIKFSIFGHRKKKGVKRGLTGSFFNHYRGLHSCWEKRPNSGFPPILLGIKERKRNRKERNGGD